MARAFAIASYQTIDEKIRPPVCSSDDLKAWDFLMTVGAVHVAVNSLPRESKDRFARLSRIVIQELDAWHSRGLDALEDCRTFVQQSLQRTTIGPTEVRAEDILGMWVLWNIYGRCTTYEESKPARIIGDMLVAAFDNWWD
jgi:hypothetical protein